MNLQEEIQMQCLKYGWKQGECMKRSKNSLVCVCHT